MSKIHKSKILFSSQLHDIKYNYLQIRNVEIVCWFENFEFARFEILRIVEKRNHFVCENRKYFRNIDFYWRVRKRNHFAYAFCNYFKNFNRCRMSKNKTILYANLTNISATICWFFESICFDFNNYLIFIFDNFLCFDFEITFSIEFKNDIQTKFIVILIKSTIKMNASIFTTTIASTSTISSTKKHKDCFFS